MFFNSFCELIFPFLFLFSSDRGVASAKKISVHWTAREKPGRFTKFHIPAASASSSELGESCKEPGTIQLRERENALKCSAAVQRESSTPSGMSRERESKTKEKNSRIPEIIISRIFQLNNNKTRRKKLQKFLAM
jgi:hypothetical protein